MNLALQPLFKKQNRIPVFLPVFAFAFVVGGCGRPVEETPAVSGTEFSASIPVSRAWADPDDITVGNTINICVEYMPVSHGEDEVIRFSDPGMEAHVRFWANKPEGDLYRSDVWDIHYIDVGYGAEGETNVVLKEPVEGTCFRVVDDYIDSDKMCPGADIPDIRSLCDLAYFESLQVIEIGSQFLENIEDISGAEKCENLSVFRIRGKAPENLEVIGEMKNLVLLSLDYGENLDLSIVQGLDKMKVLDLSRTSVLSLEPLTGLPLNVLSLGCDMGTRDLVNVDFAPLAEMTELRVLDVSNVDSFTLEDVEYLKGLGHLTMLEIYGAEIENNASAIRKELPNVRVLTSFGR